MALWGWGNSARKPHAPRSHRRRRAPGDRADAPLRRRRDRGRAAPRVRPRRRRDRPDHGRHAARIRRGAGARGARFRSLRHQAHGLLPLAGGAARHADPGARRGCGGPGARPLPDRRRARRRGHGAPAPDHALGAARALCQRRGDGHGGGQHGGRPAGDGALGLLSAAGRLDADLPGHCPDHARGHRLVLHGPARCPARQRGARHAAGKRGREPARPMGRAGRSRRAPDHGDGDLRDRALHVRRRLVGGTVSAGRARPRSGPGQLGAARHDHDRQCRHLRLRAARSPARREAQGGPRRRCGHHGHAGGPGAVAAPGALAGDR